MLHSRIMICVTIATMFTSVIAGAGEPVMVELKSGRLLRASAIEPDSASTNQVILVLDKPSIQMQRGVTWTQIKRLAAPADQLAKLQIPENVEVADRTDFAERMPAVAPPLVLADKIPPAPSPATGFQTAVSGVVPASVSASVGCVLMFRDPGVIVGVRDYPAFALPTCTPLVNTPRP